MPTEVWNFLNIKQVFVLSGRLCPASAFVLLHIGKTN